MPAEEEELKDLLAEGNTLLELASPTRIVLDEGRVMALQCVRNALGMPDADGRRRPVPVADSSFQIEAHSIVLAIGQRPDIAFLDGSSVSLRDNGAIAVDAETGQAGAPRVYAGGDATRGPAIIVEACADGRRAAEAICAQLGVTFTPLSAPLPELSAQDILQVKRARARKEAQHQPGALPLARRSGFDLVERTFTKDVAQREAARCLQCATLCDKCVEVCPNRANYTYHVSPVNWTLPLLACQQDGFSPPVAPTGSPDPRPKNPDWSASRPPTLVVAGTEPFRITQSRQILHVDDLCNECGNCATFCVHQGKPYIDKPRLFLSRADFHQEDNNAFYIAGNTIHRRENGHESTLTLKDGQFAFESAQIDVRLSSQFETIQVELRAPFEGTLSLKEAAEMALILGGVTASLPFLLGA
jgi:putative selenate reductase